MQSPDFDHMKCVWMSSGNVDYKLCDQNFDCDHCAFDKKLWKRNSVSDVSSDVQVQGIYSGLRKKILDEHESSETRLMHNLVLRKLFNNTYLIGFTQFLWAYLEPVGNLTCNIVQGVIKKGETLLTLTGAWGTETILAPFDLFVLSNLINEKNPFQSECRLCLVEAEEVNINQYATSKKSFIEQADKQAVTIAKEIIGLEQVGATMYDGGTPVKFLYPLLGKEKYVQHLRELLELPSKLI